MIRSKVGAAFMTVFLAVAGEAGAQTAVDISILDRGKPAPDVEISAILDSGKVVVGTSNASGQVTIDMNAVNITKGTEVTVWIKTCEDGKVEVILVPAGKEGECTEEGAQAGEDCGCRRAGTIIWGDGPVTIDVGTGTVTQTGGGGGAATGSSWNVGLGFDLRQMLNLEDVLAEVPGGSDESATSWAPGVQFFGEWQYRKILAVGLDAAYSRMETEIRFPQGLQTGDLDYYEAGINAKIGVPTKGRVWPYATVALHRTWNKGDFTLGSQSDHRVHKTRRDGVGAGLDYYPRPNWGLRLEGMYNSTFEDHDADEHIRWKLGVMYRIGGYGTQEPGGLYE